MKLIECSVKADAWSYIPGNEDLEDSVYNFLGQVAGTCYNKGTNGTVEENTRRLFNRIISQGHLSVLEHVSVTMCITCDRATANALVRHRHCAFTQESTIYSKYNDDVTFVDRPVCDPLYPDKPCPGFSDKELEQLEQIEKTYKDMLSAGVSPGYARDILPNCTATTLYMTTNLREWLYLIKLRTESRADSVRMHVVAQQMLKAMLELYPRLVNEYAIHPEK